MSTAHRRHQPSGPKATFFDGIAESGDGFAFKPADRLRLVRLRRRLGDLQGLRVLEPGCGSGPLTQVLSRWVGPHGQVTAFDPSAIMLGRCRKAVGRRPNVDLIQTRCEEAHFARRAFDRVICFRVLPHFDDPAAAFARFARWLKRGGRLYIVHWDSREALAAIHAANPAVAGDLLPPPAELAAALRRHGFAIVNSVDDKREIYLEAVRW